MGSLIYLSPHKLDTRVDIVLFKDSFTIMGNHPKFCNILTCRWKTIHHFFGIKLKIDRSKCKWWTHSKVDNNPRASPTCTSQTRVNHSVFAKTKVPLSSLIQTHIPTLLESWEKEASILHLNLPSAGLIHFTFPSCRGCARDVSQILCASCQSLSITFSLSTT